MGILLYVYVYTLILFNTIVQNKLYAVNTKSTVNTLNTVLSRYNFFLDVLNVSNKKINFFKKSYGLNIFFRENILGACCNISKYKVFSNEKKNFFIFNFLIFFFLKNYFNVLFKNNLVVDKNLNNDMFVFLQIAIPALKFNNLENNAIFFINFNKFFDFFFAKRVLFVEKQKFIKIVLNTYFILNKINSVADIFKINFLTINKAKKYNFFGLSQTNDLTVTDTPKYLFLLNSFFTKNKKFFFLRNNEIYNKSRYSRNRQTYKTGVFWCIWLTVLTVIGLYFYFYIFLIKFTYIWIFFYLFIVSFFFYYFRSKIERHFFF